MNRLNTFLVRGFALFLFLWVQSDLIAQPASPDEGNATAHGLKFPTAMTAKKMVYLTPQVRAAIVARANWLNTQTDSTAEGAPQQTQGAGITSLVTQQPIPLELQEAAHKILTADPANPVSESKSLLLTNLTSVTGGDLLKQDFEKLIASMHGLTRDNQVMPAQLYDAWANYNTIIDKAELNYMSQAPPSLHLLQFIFTIFTR